MSTNIETNNATSKMPGRRPSLSQSIGQSLSVAFGRKDSYYYEVEFITETPSHHSGEKMQVLTNYATIGRGTNNVIRYKGEGIEGLVSGVHASITRNGGEWTLEHLSQTNRTVINGGQRTIRPDDPFKKYVLQDGDTIHIDIPNRVLEVQLSDEEIEKRRASFVLPEPKEKTGYLSRYAKLVTSANTGAVLSTD